MTQSHTSTGLAPDQQRDALTADPLRFGVGARLTIAAMSDHYPELILGALQENDPGELRIETGDVSTFIGGAEDELLRYLTGVTATVARTGVHASISLLLSRGCPGEVVCDLPGGAGPREVTPPAGVDVGRYASAEWALYPLADEVHAGVEPDHMRDIYAAIDLAKELGTFRGSVHFVTRLEGDLGRILQTVLAGWVLVGRTVQHVTSHLTVSVNSPSHAHVDI